MKTSLPEKLPEASYPTHFHNQDSKNLFKLIKKKESMVVVGMSRVGISNFLRFVFASPQVLQENLGPERKNYLFITADANDMTEISLHNFWLLTFKRFGEAVKNSDYILEDIKKQISIIYEENHEYSDPFHLFDSLKKGVEVLVEQLEITPVFFFVRFDRLKEVLNSQFFANLESLKTSSQNQLIFILTSHRPLTELCPSALNLVASDLFSRTYYILPGTPVDMEPIIRNFEEKHHFKILPKISNELINLTGGHTQLLQMALISWSEGLVKEKSLKNDLLLEERVVLQCEELLGDLTEEEKGLVTVFLQTGKFNPSDPKAKYLLATGMLVKKADRWEFFSPLFADFLIAEFKNGKKETTDLTNKENLLFNHLKKYAGFVCEREEIVNAIWPEYEDMGISDWAIDRLVSRLRKKIASENYKILTIRGRGYKLITTQ